MASFIKCCLVNIHELIIYCSVTGPIDIGLEVAWVLSIRQSVVTPVHLPVTMESCNPSLIYLLKLKFVLRVPNKFVYLFLCVGGPRHLKIKKV